MIPAHVAKELHPPAVPYLKEHLSETEYDLIDPQYVVLERKENGILIRKIEE